MKIIHLNEIGSTNTYVAQNAASLDSDTVISTDCQTAGRGQRGNSWEAEPGKNLTFTMLVRPQNFPAIRQFSLSEAVAVAIVDVLGEELEIFAEIKWPNDIYWRDNKLAGILIEHAVMGREIMHTIIGVGLNVNQTVFVSDAPNPISLLQILTSCQADTDELLIDRNSLLEKICQRIEENIKRLTDDDALKKMHEKYMRRLWRNNGQLHKFRDIESAKEYLGFVGEIEPTGHISIYQPLDPSRHPLSRNDSLRHRYAFKEVEWIIG